MSLVTGIVGGILWGEAARNTWGVMNWRLVARESHNMAQEKQSE